MPRYHLASSWAPSVPELRARLTPPFQPLLRVFEAKYYWDDVYNAFVERNGIDVPRLGSGLFIVQGVMLPS